jgi:hypothetical protein
MPLIITDGVVANHVAVHHILQLQQGCRFVPADVPEVIRTGTPQCQRAGILVFLDVNLVKSAVVVVFHPETDRTHQLIVFNKLNISDGMDFLATADHFIGTIVVNELKEV